MKGGLSFLLSKRMGYSWLALKCLLALFAAKYFNPIEMSLIFDDNGFLTPNNAILTTLDVFENIFVSKFLVSSTRKAIFENYKRYVADFQKDILPNFKQWINGSFVTKKLNPNDIDLVTFIPFDAYDKKRKELEARFIMGGALKSYGVDAYAIKVYPQGHELHFVTLHDIAEWRETFSKTKFNRARKRYPKGFLELNF